MSAKTKSVDNTLFYVLLGLVLLGLASAVLLLVVTDRTPETFSSISFDDPQGLPNKVKTGQNYSFEYTIKNFEQNETEYDVQTNLELYRLYDTTEGIYSCLSPYRRKVYVGWNNETQPTHLTIPDNNAIIPDLVILPDTANKVEWDTYYLEFSLGRAYGKGEFVIYFEADNKTKYKYSLNELTKQIYFENTPIGTLNLSKQNDIIKISYDGEKVSFEYNGEKIHSEEVFDGSNGQFGFESRDMFVSVSRMSIHKNKEVEIPDKDNIWEYAIYDELFYNKLSESRNQASKTIRMSRNYITDPIDSRIETPGIINGTEENLTSTTTSSNSLTTGTDDTELSEEEFFYKCDNEYTCNYLENKERIYNIKNINMTSLALSTPNTNYGSRFWLQTRDYNDSLILWESFNMDISYESLSETDSIFFMFGEDFAFQINKGSYSVITNVVGGLLIEQYPLENQKNYSVFGDNLDNFSINVDRNKIKIKIGEKEIEKEISATLNNKSFRMFHVNTYSSVRTVDILNSKEECNADKNEFYEFCEIIYEFERAQPREPQVDLTQYGSLTTVNNIIPEITTDQDSLVPEIQKEKIPTKTVAFDGPISIIQNDTNKSFGAEYKYLDGKGIVKMNLHALDGSVILSLTTDAINKQADIKYTLNNKNYTDEHKVLINRVLWQRWSINLKEKNTEIYLNGTKVFDIPLKVNSGYFSMTTDETHIEKRHTYIQNLNTGKRINFPHLEDPCQLRLIYTEKLYDDNVILEDGEEKTIQSKFTLNNYFDYGKVDVLMNGSSNTNNTALGIQFWMVRT